MPELSNSEFDRLMSEYAEAARNSAGRLTGEQLFVGIDPGAAFGDLTVEKKFIYTLIAETAEEVLAEQEHL
jgi:hypothetical protein